MHVEKLLPYQADFGEELHNWIQVEELGDHQAEQPVTSADSSREPFTNPVSDSPHDAGSEGYHGVESEEKSLSRRLPHHSAGKGHANSLTDILLYVVSVRRLVIWHPV